ncbi:MAG: alpha/beta fold hydrolase [Actinobacteria bacterium]|nr:alpha/beta fold hydrolase [Actinomycetota bacterium]
MRGGEPVDVRTEVPGRHRLPATLVLPDRDGHPAPGALLVHGLGSDRDEVGGLYSGLAARLALLGVASLRFDLPGSGESPLPFTANTIGSMAGDARAALRWLADRREVDGDRLAVVGFSLGGVLASLVAGEEPGVRALALWSTAADPSEAMARVLEHEAEAGSRGSVVVDLGFRTVQLGAAFFPGARAADPPAALSRFPGALLVVAGGADPPAAVSATLLAGASAGGDTTVHVLPGIDHTLGGASGDRAAMDEVIDVTARWLAGRLGGAGSA